MIVVHLSNTQINMSIGQWLGDFGNHYTSNELGQIFSSFSNLTIDVFGITDSFLHLLSKQNVSTVIKFINMFVDINNFETIISKSAYSYSCSVAGNIMRVIAAKHTEDKIFVYKIMDYLFKLGIDTNMEIMYIRDCNGLTYGIDYLHTKLWYQNYDNHEIVNYMINNYNIIQNVRKIINNYDILLFDITDDLQFIELVLLITKCKHKNLPKFVITHKILYYYLLDKNIEFNNT